MTALQGLDDARDRKRYPQALAVLAAIVMVGLMAVLRLGVSRRYMLPIGYGVPVVAIAWFRNRRLLWVTSAAFALLTIIKFFWIMPTEVGPHLYPGVYDRIAGMMVLFDLFLVTVLADLWVTSASASERRNAELALANTDLAHREEEAAQLFQTVSRERHRFETVLRTVPFGVAVADSDGSDARLNPAGAALLNAPTEQNVASDVAVLWKLFRNGEPLPLDRYPLARALAGDEVPAEEVEVALANNRRLVLLANARPIRDGEGKIQGAVAAFADITPQKELQRELDVRRREAEEASVRKTRFLAAVSHDIRTPANAISLLAELIRRTAANPALAVDIPELARELQASASSLVHLLGDVLDLARFDSGKIELQESEFDLTQLLAEENRHMQPLAREKGLLLEVAAAAPLILRSDRIKIARILGNLVGNAIKFTEKGSVRIEAGHAADKVRISIGDTGVGIAPEHQRHIFDEFFQLRNPERDRNKGSGLGLTICRRLVDALGGNLEVQSEVGVGSTFTVTLPATGVVPTGGV